MRYFSNTFLHLLMNKYVYFENKIIKTILNITVRFLYWFVDFFFSSRNILANISLDCIALKTYSHPVIDYCTSADQLLPYCKNACYEPLVHDLSYCAIEFHPISITWVFRVIHYTPWLFHSTNDPRQIPPSYFSLSPILWVLPSDQHFLTPKTYL